MERFELGTATLGRGAPPERRGIGAFMNGTPRAPVGTGRLTVGAKADAYGVAPAMTWHSIVVVWQ